MTNKLGAIILENHTHRKTTVGVYSSSKTVCVTACLTAIGIDLNAFHSTSTAKNIDAYEGVIMRNGFALRSRKSSMPKGASVGACRKAIQKLDDPRGTLYLVRIAAHVLLLDASGETVVDTAPRQRDRRAIMKIHAIFPK
jgi:hypothetical protein